MGRVISESIADDGFAVNVHYAGNRARADDSVAGIIGNGGRAIAGGGDITDENDMAALFDVAEDQFGSLDVLVHTAGIMPLSPLAQTDWQTFDEVQRTNVRGTFIVDQLATQRVRGGGTIVNVSERRRTSPRSNRSLPAQRGGGWTSTVRQRRRSLTSQRHHRCEVRPLQRRPEMNELESRPAGY